MKKVLVSILTGMMVLAFSGIVSAGDYSYTTTGLNSMDHGSAYSWGLDTPDFAIGEEITRATLFFENIKNWQIELNRLYVSVLDFDEDNDGINDYDVNVGVRGRTDSFAGFSNYFLDIEPWYNAVESFQLVDLNDTPTNITMDITTGLSELVTFASSGVFGLGFDPDCHFYATGVTLFLHTEIPDNSVPEPATLMLFGAGLLCFASRMRKKTQA